MRDTLFIDIETIPNQDPRTLERVKSKLSPPAQMTKQDTIDNWWAEKSEQAAIDAYRKCSLDGATNQIITIGFAFNNGNLTTVSGNDERRVLSDFFDYVGKASHTIVGHNVTGFDLKVIKQRCMVHGLKLPLCLVTALKSKPWDGVVHDTMTMWGDARSYVSLDTVAWALGIEGKGDVDGSQVYDMWLNGQQDDIDDYCRKDVELTRAVYNKLKLVM